MSLTYSIDFIAAILYHPQTILPGVAVGDAYKEQTMYGPRLDGRLKKESLGVHLRPPCEEDIPSFCRWLGDRSVTTMTGQRFAPSPGSERDWLQQMAGSREDVIWTIEVARIPIGVAGIHNIHSIDRHGTTGIMIGDDRYRGRGVGSEAIRLRTAYTFMELDLFSLYSEVREDNASSLGALRKNGYREIGRRRQHVYANGQRYDMILLQVLQYEWKAMMII